MFLEMGTFGILLLLGLQIGSGLAQVPQDPQLEYCWNFRSNGNKTEWTLMRHNGTDTPKYINSQFLCLKGNDFKPTSRTIQQHDDFCKSHGLVLIDIRNRLEWFTIQNFFRIRENFYACKKGGPNPNVDFCRIPTGFHLKNFDPSLIPERNAQKVWEVGHKMIAFVGGDKVHNTPYHLFDPVQPNVWNDDRMILRMQAVADDFANGKVTRRPTNKFSDFYLVAATSPVNKATEFMPCCQFPPAQGGRLEPCYRNGYRVDTGKNGLSSGGADLLSMSLQHIGGSLNYTWALSYGASPYPIFNPIQKLIMDGLVGMTHNTQYPSTVYANPSFLTTGGLADPKFNENLDVYDSIFKFLQRWDLFPQTPWFAYDGSNGAATPEFQYLKKYNYQNRYWDVGTLKTPAGKEAYGLGLMYRRAYKHCQPNMTTG